MKHVAVKSSQVKSIGYDPERRVMEILFHTGARYQYQGVSAAEHKAVVQAESVGKHLHANVKGNFKFEKMKESKGK